LRDRIPYNQGGTYMQFFWDWAHRFKWKPDAREIYNGRHKVSIQD
jgi:hypothetical protein